MDTMTVFFLQLRKEQHRILVNGDADFSCMHGRVQGPKLHSLESTPDSGHLLV